MAEDHRKIRLQGIRCDKIKRGMSDMRMCNRLLLTKDGLMCDRCKSIHPLTDLLRRAFKAGLNPKEVLEIPVLKQELEKQVTEMIEKNKKSKKTKKKTKKISIFFCPACKKHQQESGGCKSCLHPRTERIRVGTGAEYCRLLGRHRPEKVGQTDANEPGRKHVGGSEMTDRYAKGYYRRAVLRCLWCGEKTVEKEFEKVRRPLYDAYGEQP